MAQYSSVAVQTESGRVEIMSSGSWVDIPGVSGISESGGDATTREINTFQNTIQHTSNVKPPTISISIAGYVPTLPIYKTIDDAKRGNRPLTFRYTFAEQEIRPSSGNGNTAAIAQTTGAVTFAGDTPDFTVEELGRGMALKIGNRSFVITTISENGAVTVVDGATLVAPTAQVAASPFSVVIPSQRRPAFSARIMTFANLDGASEGDLNTTLDIAPLAVLPDWEIA